MEEHNWTIDDLNEDQLTIYHKTIADQYYQYDLKGVVVHMGTAESGHYYSFI